MRKFLLFEDWTILLQGKSVDDQWKSIREMIQETVRRFVPNKVTAADVSGSNDQNEGHGSQSDIKKERRVRAQDTKLFFLTVHRTELTVVV
jgi:hypothetical protein